MIVLHGRGDSLKPFRFFDEELKIRNINYLLLNANRKYLDGFSWYSDPPNQANSVVKNRNRLIQLLDELRGWGWSSKNIFLLGFSQGGLVSADLAMTYDQAFAGIISVSSYFHFFSNWRRRLNCKNIKTPWLFIHGTKDDVLPWKETYYGYQKIRQAGLSADWHLLEKDHVMIEEDYKIIRPWIRRRLR
jgi:phospholipase/carboxylesterase